MEGDFEGDFENSAGERDLSGMSIGFTLVEGDFLLRGGGLKFLGWICVVCLLL